jgi:predicted MFS family arabinose efflux permease
VIDRSAPNGLVAAAIIAASALGSFSLLFPITPILASELGSSRFVSGTMTGAFMATTIVAQLIAPVALRRIGFRAILAVGSLFVGLPAAGLIPWHDNISAMLAIGAIRGIGFGLLTVSCSALPPHLVKQGDVGRAIATQGMVTAGASTLCLFLGIRLYDSCGITAVVSAAVALTMICLVVTTMGIPKSINEPAATESDAVATDELAPAMWPTCTLIFGASIAYGGLSSLIPVVDSPQAAISGIVLATMGGLVVFGRYGAGRFAQRINRFRAYRQIGVAACVVGLFLFALSTTSRSALIPVSLVGAILFGVGLGWTQNVTLVHAFRSVPAPRFGFASAAWNVSVDAGLGTGSMVLGATADWTGFEGAYLLSAGLLLLTGVVTAFLPVRRGQLRTDKRTNDVVSVRADVRSLPPTV